MDILQVTHSQVPSMKHSWMPPGNFPYFVGDEEDMTFPLPPRNADVAGCRGADLVEEMGKPFPAFSQAREEGIKQKLEEIRDSKKRIEARKRAERGVLNGFTSSLYNKLGQAIHYSWTLLGGYGGRGPMRHDKETGNLSQEEKSEVKPLVAPVEGKLLWNVQFRFWRSTLPHESAYNLLFSVYMTEPPNSEHIRLDDVVDTIPWRDHLIQTRIQRYPGAPDGFGSCAQRTVYAQVNRDGWRTSPWFVVIYLFCSDREWLRRADVRGGLLPKLAVESDYSGYQAHVFGRAAASEDVDPCRWYYQFYQTDIDAQVKWAAKLIGKGQSLAGVQMLPTAPKIFKNRRDLGIPWNAR